MDAIFNPNSFTLLTKLDFRKPLKLYWYLLHCMNSIVSSLFTCIQSCNVLEINKIFFQLELFDVLLLTAMSPPGTGRNSVPLRFTRHLNAFSIDQFDDTTLRKIFSTEIEWHFKKDRNGKEIFVILLTYLIGDTGCVKNVHFMRKAHIDNLPQEHCFTYFYSNNCRPTSMFFFK